MKVLIMVDKNKLYIKLVKKEMNDALESGQLKAEEQYVYINGICQKLVLIDDVPIDFEGYFNDLDKLENDFKKQYKEYITKRGDMAKDMYEEIKKL